MRVLITGKGGSGSWAIRGVQAGTAIGAQVVPMASVAQIAVVSVVIGVKRIPDSLLHAIHQTGTPFVWDVVDAFPQPECTGWTREQSIAWLHSEIDRLKPSAIIWPNTRMADDAAWSGLQEVIYHHHRPGIEINPIREKIQTIAYEGSPRYLEGWAEAISEECNRLGAAFLVNPESLAAADVVIAVRGPRWNGYAQRHWKSNVKLANAHASGTAFIGMRERGYIETQSFSERWVQDPQDLRVALESLEPQSARQHVAARFGRSALTLEHVAQQYRQFLGKVHAR